MKPKILIASILLCAVAVFADTNTVPTMPEELASKPITQWVLTGSTVLFLIGVLGRAYSALKGGGGLSGVFKGIVHGTNVPPEQKP